jgi:hypothetical protein
VECLPSNTGNNPQNHKKNNNKNTRRKIEMGKQMSIPKGRKILPQDQTFEHKFPDILKP